MSEKTGIEWATHTASPWFGCSKVDALCTHCYAEMLTLRNKWAGWGDSSPRVRSKGFWKDVYKWDRDAEKKRLLEIHSVPAGQIHHFDRPRTFTSLMDWLDLLAPLDWFGDFLQVIRATQNLDHLLLTKRPENFFPRMKQARDHYSQAPSINDAFCCWIDNWLEGDAPKNVWFGYSAGTRKTWIDRHDISKTIPAKVIWCSAEPLLERLDFHDIVQDEECPNSHYLDWIVIGGESGRFRRDPGVDVICDLAQQARHCGCKVFVKQDVGLLPGRQGRIPQDIWAMKEFPTWAA